MAVAYATIASIKALGVIPNAEVDAFEAKYPGRIVEISLAESDDADSMMRPRYGVPFPLPAPPVVVKHVAAIVVWKMYLVKGINPSATQLVEIKELKAAAEAFFQDLLTNKRQLDRSLDATPSKSEGAPGLFAMLSPKEFLFGQKSGGCGGGCK